MKQVGLIVYLAHCGSFVPAESATIGLTDRMFSRMASVESISTNMSTFASDTSQVAHLLHHMTANSLLLIDEYGKGTATVDGTALLAAMIQHFVELKEKCPRTLIITHCQQFLREYAQLIPMISERVRFMQMSHLTDVVATTYDNSMSAVPTIVPLYQLVDGVSAASYGLSCAQVAGMNDAILLRAEQVAQHMNQHTPLHSLFAVQTHPSLPLHHEQIIDEFIQMSTIACADGWDAQHLDESILQRFVQLIGAEVATNESESRYYVNEVRAK